MALIEDSHKELILYLDSIWLIKQKTIGRIRSHGKGIKSLILLLSGLMATKIVNEAIKNELHIIMAFHRECLNESLRSTLWYTSI